MSYLNWNKKQAEINLQPGSGASPGRIKKDFSRGVLGLFPNPRHPPANLPLDVICLVHFKALATFLHFSKNRELSVEIILSGNLASHLQYSSISVL